MDPKWANDEQQHWFNELWEKLKPRIRNILIENLEHMKTPLVDDIFDIEPDWSEPTDWDARSRAIRVHNCATSYDEEEELLQFSGRIQIYRGTVGLLPSFKFILDDEKRKLRIGFSVIRKMLIEKEKLDKDSALGVFGESDHRKLMLKSKPNSIDKQRESDILEGLKFFGFKKDEAYLVLHDAVAHNNYSEKMDIGEVVKLGLDIHNKKI